MVTLKPTTRPIDVPSNAVLSCAKHVSLGDLSQRIHSFRRATTVKVFVAENFIPIRSCALALVAQIWSSHRRRRRRHRHRPCHR
jgi:hypothetical protein